MSRIESTRRRLPIALSSRQLARSPGAWTDRRVSRQQHTGIDNVYWYAVFPGQFALRRGATGVIRPRRDDDHHLRSSRELVGYYVHARDDEIGHISDFLMDERSWAIRYAVVDTRNWWPGKIVLVPVEYILWVSWGAATIYVDLFRSTIGNAPPYDPDRALKGRDETRLLEYYDHSKQRHMQAQA